MKPFPLLELSIVQINCRTCERGCLGYRASRQQWYNEKCINCDKCINLLFSQFLLFSSILLTKNVKRFDIFRRGSSGNFDEKCIEYFLHVSFSVAMKNVKILLQAREVLNFERHPNIVCISWPEPNAAR